MNLVRLDALYISWFRMVSNVKCMHAWQLLNHAGIYTHDDRTPPDGSKIAPSTSRCPVPMGPTPRHPIKEGLQRMAGLHSRYTGPPQAGFVQLVVPGV